MHEELFGERAYTTVRSWFLQLVLGSPTGTVPGRSAFEDEALDKPLVETSPYLVMLSKASSEGEALDKSLLETSPYLVMLSKTSFVIQPVPHSLTTVWSMPTSCMLCCFKKTQR